MTPAFPAMAPYLGWLSLLLLLLLACGADRSTDQYGFVTTLGRDTIAVERATRRGDTLSFESVDRWVCPARTTFSTELAMPGCTVRRTKLPMFAAFSMPVSSCCQIGRPKNGSRL